MTAYQPPYTITSKVLSQVTEISEALGASALKIQNSPQLRKQNRIKTIAGTLAIEGNTLEIEQVAAIVDGRAVRGSQKEIAEVRGAIKAYDKLAHYQSHSINDLLDAHKNMMEELMPDAGHFRRGNVGIYKGSKVTHVAPQAHRVPTLIQDLVHWLSHTDAHPLISSCIFHYEFEFIHPFSDGNGRIGRLWQTLILGQWRDIFYALPIENAIKHQQQAYYDALEAADAAVDSTIFIEFMLSVILTNITAATDPVTDPVSDPATDLVSDPVTNLVSEPTTNLVSEPATNLVSEPVTDLVSEPATDLVSDPVTDPVTDLVSDPVTDLVSDPVTNLVSDPVTNLVSEPVTNLVSDPVTDLVSEPVTDPVKKLLAVMDDGYFSSAQIMEKVGLSHKPTFRKNYLLPALAQGLISMSYPDTPNNPKQKYRKNSNI